MPKRTNRFQKLITFLEQQLGPLGATVTPSAMVPDSVSGTPREVDILIEASFGHHVVRMGVECRDHKRKQSVEWIEQLAGKFEHLPVNKVVAVSRSGFTREAMRRAEHHNIALFTLERALDADWLQAVAQYKFSLVIWSHPMVAFECNYMEDGKLDLSNDELIHARIEDASGRSLGEMKDDVIMLYNTYASRDTRAWANENAKELFAQPPGYEWDLRLTFNAHNRFLVTPSGERRQLKEVILCLKASYRLEDASLEYFSYSNQPVAVGSVRPMPDQGAVNVALLFSPDGRPKAVNLEFPRGMLSAGEQAV